MWRENQSGYVYWAHGYSGRTKAHWATKGLKDLSPYIGEKTVSFLLCGTKVFLYVCRRRGISSGIGSNHGKERALISWILVHQIVIKHMCVI